MKGERLWTHGNRRNGSGGGKQGTWRRVGTACVLGLLAVWFVSAGPALAADGSAAEPGLRFTLPWDGGFNLKGSPEAFDNFVAPVSNPIYAEDPRNTTEFRAVYLWQQTPGDSTLQHGHVDVWAFPFSVALTENFSIIATKAGVAHIDTGLLDGRDGWLNISIGGKWTFLRDDANGFLASVGATYEIPCGQHPVFQGKSDGEFNLFLTSGKEFGNLHLLGTTGFRIPCNHHESSSAWYWNGHIDYKVLPWLVPFFEINGIHWIDGGDEFPFDFEGGDLINLGSHDVTGNDLVTLAPGVRFVINRNLSCGVAYEFPVTGREDILNQRWTFDIILRY